MRIEDWFKIGMKRNIPSILDMGGKSLNLGAGNQVIEGVIPLDLPCWDAKTMPIPFPDGSIDSIHAHHFFEHFESEQVLVLLKECERVLVIGGRVLITVPQGGSTSACQDINHKTFWTTKSLVTLLSNAFYDPAQTSGIPIPLFKVHTSFLMGINEKNVSICFQLVKVEKDSSE